MEYGLRHLCLRFESEAQATHFLRYLYYLHHFFNPRLAETTRAADGAPCRVSGEWCRNWHNIIHLLPSNSEERLILLDQGDENDNDGD